MVVNQQSATGPAIVHMKVDGRTGRNPLEQRRGDALPVVFGCAAHNICMPLRLLSPIYIQILLQIPPFAKLNFRSVTPS